MSRPPLDPAMSDSRNTADPCLIAVVVTYNRIAQLRKSLQHTLAEAFDHVLVVNNGSTDGTDGYLDQLAASCARLEVIHQSINIGGAGGFHVGLSRLQVLYQLGDLPQHSWAVLYDDDSYPDLGCIECFRSASSSRQGITGIAAAVFDDAGFVAEVNRPIINIFRFPRQLISQVHSGSCHTIRDLYHVPSHQILQRGYCMSVDAISFVGLFLNLSELSKLLWPMPDIDLFLYGDDTLYTWGLRDRGATLIFDSDLRFIHETSTGYREGVIMPVWKLFYITRNSWFVYRRLAGFLAGIFLFLIGTLSKAAILARYSDPSARRGALRAIFLGLSDLVRARKQRSLQSVRLFVES